MEIFFILASLIVASFFATLVYERLHHRVPLAFLQIVAGLIAAMLSSVPTTELDPELFLMLVIAPLLFNEAQKMKLPKRLKEMQYFFKTTFALAWVLAAVTILLIGFFAGYVLKGYPLAVCIALAAILTPTDATALLSLTAGRILPKKIKGFLENESLFNDATGLVMFSLALTTFSTGEFQVSQGIFEFFKVAVGGIVLGVIGAWGLINGRLWIKRQMYDEIALLVPYHLMTPFILYLAAEHLGVSGILAVVAGGIVHSYERGILKLNSSRLQLVTTSVWEIISQLLNGIVFVLLGVSLPSVWQGIVKSPLLFWELVAVALSLYLGMTILRFLWIYFDFSRLAMEKETRFHDATVFALSGMHGTITLAMAFSLPLTIGGQGFPHRDELIFISMVVIFASLLIPSIAFHWLLPVEKKAFTAFELKEKRDEMVDYALSQIGGLPVSPEQKHQLIQLVRSQKDFVVDQVNREDYLSEYFRIFSEAQSVALAAVETTVHEKGYPTKIIDFYAVLQRRERNVVARQRTFNSKVKGWFLRKRAKQTWKQRFPYSEEFLRSQLARNAELQTFREKWDDVEEEAYQKAQRYLLEQEHQKPNEWTIVDHLMRHFERSHARFQTEWSNEAEAVMSNDLLIQAFQFEYTFVQKGMSDETISEEMATELYQMISNAELIQLQTVED